MGNVNSWCNKCWEYFKQRNGQGGIKASIVLTQCCISDPEFHKIAGEEADAARANAALAEMSPLCCRYPEVLQWLKDNPDCTKDEADAYIIKKFGALQ